PDVLLKRCALKLGVPNIPGETLKLRGSVKQKDEAAGTLQLEVVGANSWGDHVTAAVTVALPTGA
ncbi:MAG: acyl dehydratase, partial [Myxococcota bacterium]